SLNCPMTTHLIRKYKIKILIDAAPIYFKGASVKTMSACRMTGTRYIRFEPPGICLDGSMAVYRAKNIEDACDKAMSFGKTIFLNIGNNNMNVFTKRAAPEGKRIVVRVSDTGALTNSLKFGIDRHDILLIDGVFSEDFNRGLIKEYGISVFIIRELGAGSGMEQELSAAGAEGIPAVIIERPKLNYPKAISDYEELAREVFK
ncbi:MAG: precorrin-6A/cobalt-precorrin-6A reductase, partial [Candidatus Omnitrophota bacterium]|nr:precorrin-6A/cobalt-precorrin-6A reductase [Candidatus Omnitrophota bacterium]